MPYPIKVLDIELSLPLKDIAGLDGYHAVQGLVRLLGEPIGYVQVPITMGYCRAADIAKSLLDQQSWAIICQLLQNGLSEPIDSKGLRVEELFEVQPYRNTAPAPLVTVAVCTRNRTADLEICLGAIRQLDYPNLDVLIVDNAPTENATRNLIQTNYPNFRYVCEPRPGLNWARNRAAIEARGEFIAYTDDDVIVDPGWISALVNVFVENPDVMAMTGLIVPYELQTKAQILFELKDGFGRGFKRKWYRVSRDKKMPWWLVAAVGIGAGANMAYRRGLFEEIGYFDPALDVGTVTNGAGDLEMFFRVIKEGHTLVYEPNALVRHRHRRHYDELRTQFFNNGSVYSYFVAGSMAYPDEIPTYVRLGVSWVWSWHLRRFIKSLVKPIRLPRELILAEMKGCFAGLTRYKRARETATQIEKTHGSLTRYVRRTKPKPLKNKISQTVHSIAIRTVELTRPLKPLVDVTCYSNVRVFINWKDAPLGSVDIPNENQIIGITRLKTAIVETLNLKLIEPERNQSQSLRWAKAAAALEHKLNSFSTETSDLAACTLPHQIPVSVIVGTYDRPNDLRECLHGLVAQQTSRPLEIIVVDNHPVSGLTPPVVAEFPKVKLVSEARQGVAYARNAGIIASQGDIVATTDDDVVIPPGWLEKLIAPLARADVMAVTSNVSPYELDTDSQRLFENYGDGGLGRGFERFEVNVDWFEKYTWKYVVPVWLLGGTANAAFRASIFSHPEIGLMDVALGPGMPSGVGEDIYLFYKILKAGYTIVYEPQANLWHKHRRSMKDLRRQLYSYSKGIVCHHLTTLLRDGDLRTLYTAAIHMPMWHLRRIINRLRRRSEHPISLILIEILGNLAGPWALWRSYRRVKHQGRSNPYIRVINNPSQLER